MHNFTLPENAKVLPVLKPATDAAGRTGRYVNLSLAHKAYIVFNIDQGNAATIVLDVVQASAAAGTGVKAISGVRRIWSDLDIATSDTVNSITAAQTYTTDAALKEKLVILEVNPSDLDVTNGFIYVAPRTGASNAANLTSATVVLVPRYQGAAQPSVTT